jgi:hypothetical protein
MKLHFTSGYYPEGNGQTECVNQTLEQYLRMYCNYQQDNWKSLLPLAEFAYNNAPNATTGVSPFFANKGYNPSIAVPQSATLPPHMPKNLSLTSMSFTKNSKKPFTLHKRTINTPQIRIDFWHLTSK